MGGAYPGRVELTGTWSSALRRRASLDGSHIALIYTAHNIFASMEPCELRSGSTGLAEATE